MVRPFVLRELTGLAALFLKLGTIGFGGPAAHIALMHDEVVRRRGWLTGQEFLDLVGATNLIPGPNSTEMAIHIGFRRAGWPGLIVGGLCFILPAMLIVMALAWVYVRFGSMPQAGWLLDGVKPVVIAVIIQAIWSLGRQAVKGPLLAVIGSAVLLLVLLGVNEILLLVAGGLVAMIGLNLERWRGRGMGLALAPPLAAGGLLASSAATATAFSLSLLFVTFLKIGAVLYGSGYVLLAFLHADFVGRFGWLTDRQLMDAVAVGQVTPGPLFTTATFIGYLLGGAPGALLATLGIFLPAFIFVALSNPLISRMRRSPWIGGLLDGVNAASLGLMAAVTWQLGRTAVTAPITLLIAAVSFVLLVRYKLNPTWLIAGGAAIGVLSGL
ncbi:MAG: chromate efflux transporter [Nitrospirae bacterium]|nr:chromate efflux transporter [Nitrospirota bacterium]